MLLGPAAVIASCIGLTIIKVSLFVLGYFIKSKVLTFIIAYSIGVVTAISAYYGIKKYMNNRS
jgi:hypothetical protein